MLGTLGEETAMLPKVLTIAGSDCSGGAGIQADLKTFTVLGTYGMTVVTALTAQNTRGVQSVADVDARFVTSQLDSVLSDIGTDAVKTGMLNTADVVQAVARAMRRYKVPYLVIDPVMISKSGHPLLQQDAIDALRNSLLPLASIVTPNLPEAAVLAEMDEITDARGMRLAAEKIFERGAKAVLIKGGHMTGSESNDLWFDGRRLVMLSSPRYDCPNTHGTGCTISAALAACLAKGMMPLEAARYAKNFVTEAIRHAKPLGKGIGPVNHLWQEKS